MNATPALMLTLVLGAPAPREPASGSPVVGTWAIETFSVGGAVQVLPDLCEWTFTGDGSWQVRINGKENVGVRTYVVNTKAKPEAIDFFSTVGAEPSAGIFRIDGDTLTVSLSPALGPRPTNFEPPNGSKQYMYTLRRVKE
jgi:uncharacterized protein (TIGR03067 family)